MNCSLVGSKRRMRIFCFALTSPQNIRSRGPAILSTWAKRCDKFLFASDRMESDLPTMDIAVKEGYKSLYNKTATALEYVYKYHGDYDWIIKTDDDTYIIMENLRTLLQSYSPNTPILFGDPLQQGYITTLITYFSGGGGYVMSMEALRRFAGRKRKCPVPYASIPEDAMVSMCMKSLGVTLGPSSHVTRWEGHGSMPLNYNTCSTHITTSSLGGIRISPCVSPAG